jgi:hypothetical protein
MNKLLIDAASLKSGIYALRLPVNNLWAEALINRAISLRITFYPTAGG